MIVNTEPHIVSKCGLRDSNEDVERYLLNLSPEGYVVKNRYAAADFFVICDGHGGKEVADFIAPNLEKYFMEQTSKYPLKYPLSIKYIKTVYNTLQAKLCEHSKHIAKYCGCTALVVVIYLDSRNERNVQVINIGDCRAVLSRGGLAMPLSIDHKPSWPDEKIRIDGVNLKHNTNKQVTFTGGDFRIGDLSVSRAFGDLDNTPHVTHTPDIYNYRLTSIDEFIIIACDGVWDVLRNEEAINFVRDHRTDNHIKLYNIKNVYPPTTKSYNSKNIAEKLADYAIARGSTDNVSIIIVFLNN